jgi:hypothetical protein
MTGDDCRDFRRLLVEFADGGGRTGAATALLLARFTVSHDGIDRLMAADTMVALFGTGELDVASLAKALGLIVEFEHLPMRRVAETLSAVASAGEWECVWQTCRMLLPELLHCVAPDTALVLAIAADTAAATGARGEVVELAAVADRRGSQRLVVEARRLRDILTSAGRHRRSQANSACTQTSPPLGADPGNLQRPPLPQRRTGRGCRCIGQDQTSPAKATDARSTEQRFSALTRS